MRYTKLYFILLFGLFGNSIAHAAEGDTPPSLVHCVNDMDCDRDPKHLEAFVTQFYEWYASVDVAIDHISVNEPHFQQKREKLRNERNKQLKDFLSPDLYQFKHKIDLTKEIESAGINIHACTSDSEADFITCAQDTREEWVTGTKTELINNWPDSATLIVRLPMPSREAPEDAYHNHSLAIGLTPFGGAWRISNILDPNP